MSPNRMRTVEYLAWAKFHIQDQQKASGELSKHTLQIGRWLVMLTSLDVRVKVAKLHSTFETAQLFHLSKTAANSGFNMFQPSRSSTDPVDLCRFLPLPACVVCGL